MSEFSPAVMVRLERGVNAFERADALTRRIVLAELLGTSALVIEKIRHVTPDAAMHEVLLTLENKLASAPANRN
jgi:hypothetical protein